MPQQQDEDLNEQTEQDECEGQENRGDVIANFEVSASISLITFSYAMMPATPKQAERAIMATNYLAMAISIQDDGTYLVVEHAHHLNCSCSHCSNLTGRESVIWEVIRWMKLDPKP